MTNASQQAYTVNNKLEMNSHAKIAIAIKCKSKPYWIVNKWLTLHNKYTVNNAQKRDIYST